MSEKPSLAFHIDRPAHPSAAHIGAVSHDVMMHPQRGEAQAPALDRLLTTDEVMTALGCGRTNLYKFLPHLDVRKLGRRTVATESSVRRFMADLPKADIGAGRRQAA